MVLLRSEAAAQLAPSFPPSERALSSDPPPPDHLTAEPLTQARFACKSRSSRAVKTERFQTGKLRWQQAVLIALPAWFVSSF